MQLASDAKDKYCIYFIFDDHQPPFLGKQHLKITASDFANLLNNFKQVYFLMHSWEIPKMQQNFNFECA
jgi:hypothetical protein